MSVPAQSRTAAVVVAAGQSTRLRLPGDGPRKPFLLLEGLTVVEHACLAFDAVAAVAEIVLVGNAEDLARLAQLAAHSSAMKKVKTVVPGGELRTDSVRAGIAAVSPECELVAIHDAARPLVTPAVIERALALATQRGAALVAVPLVDTVKTSSDAKHAQSTLDRSVLWSAQTPQVFRTTQFRELLERARADDYRPTDDAALYERYVGGVPLSDGDAHNLKLTTPADLVIAGAILRARREQSQR